MSEVTIRTNHTPRYMIDWHDLTQKERERFDWLDTTDKQQDATFVRYRGWTFCLDEFMQFESKPNPFEGWDGYSGDSYFSGTLIKFVDGDQSVIMGNYYT